MTNLFLPSLIIFLALTTASAQSFYVNGSSGSNSNTGTDPDHAWKTIQKAMDDATPGSTVFIKAGTYAEHLELNVSGTAGQPITFTSQAGETVIVEGNNQNGTLLYVENQNYFNITGLVFQNTLGNNSAGVIITGSSGHFKFNRNTVQGIKWTINPNTVPGSNNNCNPFVVYGDALTSIKNIVIDSNVIRNNINGFSENLTLDGNVEAFTISNNKVYDNTNIGIDCAGNYGVCSNPALDQARNGIVVNNLCYNNVSNYATSAGIYVDGGRDIVIERNICYGNGWGIEIGAEEDGTVSNIIVRDNLIFHNIDSGLAFGGYTTETLGQVINSTFINNTLFENDLSMHLNGEIYMSKASNCVFRNNIVRSNEQNTMITRVDITPQMNNTFAYNCWSTPSDDPEDIDANWGSSVFQGFAIFELATGDTNAIFSNPSFINPAGAVPDLHLSYASICRDGGDPDFVAASGEKDLDGQLRIYNNRVDMGAYEVQGFVNVDHSAEKPEQPITFSPNPTSGYLYLTDGQSIKRIQVKNTFGQTVATFFHPGGSIDLSALPAGVYFMNVERDGFKPDTQKICLHP